MSTLQSFKQSWLRPLLFFGNNPISLIGGALASAAAFVLLGFWVVDAFGHSGSQNPYIGIILVFFLPAIFLFGLLLIPVGIVFRRASLKKSGHIPAVFPLIDLNDPVFRRGIDVVILATFINFVILGTATYRSVAYMDTTTFCGATCHVMDPEDTAYPLSTHSGVACVECHVASGVGGYIHAKVNGTKQLIDVVRNHYPTPVMPNDMLPPVRQTCLNCHRADANIGDKILLSTTFDDDERNTRTRSLVLLHVGGRDQANRLGGIHGAHLGRIVYISTDTTHQTIHYVAKTEANGSLTEFLDTDPKAAKVGVLRQMDCIDCHNRAAHSFGTPEHAVDQSMAQGIISPDLPFIHKQSIALLKASYSSREQARAQIAANLARFYQTNYPDLWQKDQLAVTQAAARLTTLWSQNVFPFMRVTWGSHPDNIGHNDYPGCFRCHDGSHTSASGKTITNDCSTCHNLLTIDDTNRQQLADLGLR